MRQNDDMHRISAWVAIWAVPTLLAGIYGRNFRHLPELEWAFGYPVVLVVMVLICVGLYRAFRRSGWLQPAGVPGDPVGDAVLGPLPSLLAR